MMQLLNVIVEAYLRRKWKVAVVGGVGGHKGLVKIGICGLKCEG